MNKIIKYKLIFIRILVISLLMYFFGKIIYQHRLILFNKLTDINIYFILIGILFSISAIYLSSTLWGCVLKTIGINIKISDAVNIYFASMVLKYLPGKIWATANRLYIGKKKYGVREADILMGIYFETVFMHGTAMLISAIAFLFLPVFLNIRSAYNYSIIILIAGICLIIIYPPIMQKIFNILLLIFKRKKIKIKATYLQMLTIFLLYILFWCYWTIPIFFYIKSVSNISFNYFFYILSIWAFSVSAGVLTVIMPGGLGIRESFIVILLGKIIPISDALLISVIMRFGQILAEATLIGIITKFDISLYKVKNKL